MICIDASLALIWLLPAQFDEKADALREKWDNENQRIISAPLFNAEVTSVLREQVYFKRLLPEDGKEAFEIFLSMGVEIAKDSPGLQRKAWQLANKFNRPKTYDMQYLALAEIKDCEFWTADKKLFNALGNKAPRLKYVGAL
ncbi:MAG: type II toxin-antitoxin system VapC family toxin [Armatimonadetes bacterium]|nr:type II toxin-antitoxin system VapC family toxin [Armatimonadota bacterium]